jgi:AAA domain, putative AbiEii toxin, Type IV TA system/AAA domain
MHLQRVQVPNFRALKNIDITFEKERIPRIFPLASLNGGGKSTLLQLIFTLLTCSANPDKHEFLKNILKDFDVDSDSGCILAKIQLFSGQNSFYLTFYCHSTCYLVDKFLPNENTNVLKELGFNKCLIKSEISKDEIQRLKSNRRNLEIEIERLSAAKNEDFIASQLSEYLVGEKASKLKDYNNTLQQVEFTLELAQSASNEFQLAQESKEKIRDILWSDQTYYICACRGEEKYNEVNILCHIESDDVEADDIDIDIFQEISQKIFLAAPANQVFLFFNRQDIDYLFGNRSNGENYEHIARQNQDKLPGFFIQDFSTIKILADAFAKAKHNDWQQAIKTRGQYGNEYARISKDLEYVFSGKIIEPLEDLSGIIIKTIENGKERILHPEDLSHGELRRLSFYAWLRTKEIKDAIVLVDEIEIGLHPDWQYQIVKDLEEWAPSNQYILATHSYEICSALTPAHVKEIEPKLVKPETVSTH